MSRNKMVLFLTLLFALSGCYRQAGESLEPITNPTNVPVLSTATDAAPDADTGTDFPATATFPPVTVIQPTISNPTVQVQSTAEPASPAASATESVPTGDAQSQAFPTFTPAVITPGSPSGPIVLDTPTPSSNLLLTATPSGLITPTSPFTDAQDPCVYTVRSGDNLFRIAVNHDVTLDELRAANPEIVGDLIQPGQTLTIPNCTASSVGVPIPPTAETSATTTDTTVSGQRIHTVQAGDTLVAIAQRYGVTVSDIVSANNLTNPDALSIGQQLIIP